MSDIKVAKTIDAKGLNCPMPILKLKKAIKEVNVGDIVELIATDPGSQKDVKSFTKTTGHELVKEETEGNLFRYYVKRTK